MGGDGRRGDDQVAVRVRARVPDDDMSARNPARVKPPVVRRGVAEGDVVILGRGATHQHFAIAEHPAFATRRARTLAFARGG